MAISCVKSKIKNWSYWTYTEVGDEGIEDGERDPTRCWDARVGALNSFTFTPGLTRTALDVMWRISVPCVDGIWAVIP